MAKRFAICRLGDFENDGTRVPKLNLYGCESRIWSKPGFDWCFAHVGSRRIAELQADPDIFVLPDAPMDTAVSSIPLAVRTAMRTRLESMGFVFTAVKTTWTIRQLLHYIAQQTQESINLESGDVRDQEG